MVRGPCCHTPLVTLVPCLTACWLGLAVCLQVQNRIAGTGAMPGGLQGSSGGVRRQTAPPAVPLQPQLQVRYQAALAYLPAVNDHRARVRPRRVVRLAGAEGVDGIDCVEARHHLACDAARVWWWEGERFEGAWVPCVCGAAKAAWRGGWAC